jgi:hypothetical protein
MTARRPMNPTWCAGLLALAATLSTGRAVGQTGTDRPWRLELALRGAYAIPFGQYEGTTATSPDQSLSSDIVGAVPVTLEVGARRHGALFVGLAAGYAFVNARKLPGCDVVQPCPGPATSQAFRTAVETQVALPTTARFRPWIGLDAGVEWLTSSYTTYRAVPVLGLDLGGAFAATPRTSIGPFLGLSLSRFGHADFFGATAYQGMAFPQMLPAPSRNITDPAWHGWVAIGIRGAFEP